MSKILVAGMGIGVYNHRIPFSHPLFPGSNTLYWNPLSEAMPPTPLNPIK
jgi:hypothetical protein